MEVLFSQPLSRYYSWPQKENDDDHMKLAKADASQAGQSGNLRENKKLVFPALTQAYFSTVSTRLGAPPSPAGEFALTDTNLSGNMIDAWRTHHHLNAQSISFNSCLAFTKDEVNVGRPIALQGFEYILHEPVRETQL